MAQESRHEGFEKEARRGCSQVRTTQAYPQWYVEKAERERPRRARGADAVVGIPRAIRGGLVEGTRYIHRW